MKVITSGRTDLEDYFRLSGIREQKKLAHTPFLAFLVSRDAVEVKIVESARALLDYPDETPVMAQWRGQWKSDFFQFSVRDLRHYIKQHPPETYHVV
jgi:hypothetical protein